MVKKTTTNTSTTKICASSPRLAQIMPLCKVLLISRLWRTTIHIRETSLLNCVKTFWQSFSRVLISHLKDFSFSQYLQRKLLVMILFVFCTFFPYQDLFAQEQIDMYQVSPDAFVYEKIETPCNQPHRVLILPLLLMFVLLVREVHFKK